MADNSSKSNNAPGTWGAANQAMEEGKKATQQGLEQGKKAFESFIGSVQQATNTFQKQAGAAQTSAKDLGQKVMTFTERNIETTLEFGQRLLQAKDVSEVLKLQAEYVSTQTEALTQQAKELAEATSQAVRNSTTPASKP
jgi:phasin